jgi:hypothetical protein
MWRPQGRAKDSLAPNLMPGFPPEIPRTRRESFRSPCGLDDSSRHEGIAVEFVNHPKAVFAGPVRGGAIRAVGGAGELLEIGHSALRQCAHADLWSENG